VGSLQVAVCRNQLCNRDIYNIVYSSFHLFPVDNNIHIIYIYSNKQYHDMFKRFYDDLTYLPKRKFNAKYTVPFLMFFLSCVLVGQLITIVVPLNKLNKVSGQIVNMGTVITSWSWSRGFVGHSTPNYALAITLDNMQSYNIQDKNVRAYFGSTLKNGDYITIYYPNLTLKIIGAGLIRDVSQVEFGGKILYSWKGQQNDEWFIVGILVVLIALSYWLIGFLRNSVDIPKML
jgi:hypothetical protein